MTTEVPLPEIPTAEEEADEIVTTTATREVEEVTRSPCEELTIDVILDVRMVVEGRNDDLLTRSDEAMNDDTMIDVVDLPTAVEEEEVDLDTDSLLCTVANNDQLCTT